MDPKLNRRQALGAFGTVSLGTLLSACSEDEPQRTTTGSRSQALEEGNSCRVTAELTEGPYYFDADAIRRDIREDRRGVDLRLVMRVREAEGCKPVPNAVVDIWHSDAQGVYSGFGESPQGERFLRGAQVTDDEGVTEFLTVYPGWYQGRTPHIHVKVHLDKQTVLTTQLFFDARLSARVYRDRRYVREGGEQVDNASDGIFDESLVLSTRRRSGTLVGAMTFDVESA